KLVDSLDLDGENRERTRLRLFQFSLRDQASNWLERLPAGSITTWEDLTTRFLAQFFPPRRTVKLRNDILIRTIDQSAGGKLRDLNAEESWALLEDLALYDNESLNDPRDFAKPVKAIALPQDVPSTSDRRLIELENQICSGPHDTQYCMEDPEQAFVKYASSRTNEAGDARLSTFEADFKRQQGEMTNKIDTVLKAITDQIAGTLPSDTIETEPPQPEKPEPTLEDEFQDLHLNLPILEVLAHTLIYNAILDKYVESLELGKNRSAFVQGEIPTKMEDPGLFTLPCRLEDSKPFDTLADLGSCVNIIPLYLFKKLNIRLLEETDHIFGLADGTKSYPIGIVKDIEVHIGKLKLLNDFYVIDMKMAKIAVEEGITRSVFRVKGVDLGEEEAPYWTTLGKRESYKPRPLSDGIVARTPYYAKKNFLDCHLPREWEIARDVERNPFKDTLVFRMMIEFLGAIPINHKLICGNQRT
ncbi:MAK10-like protein, partial [Tanacetum coccineum]